MQACDINRHAEFQIELVPQREALRLDSVSPQGASGPQQGKAVISPHPCVEKDRPAAESPGFPQLKPNKELWIMAKQSAQHKLDRVRPPRVQITYDVEVGGAIEVKELPFVVGVLGDFTGNPEQPLPKLKDRKFVEVNPDNFDTVLEGMKPHLAFSVENKLSDEPEAPNLKIDLKFRKMDDFEPANVAKQVKPLKELLDLRTRLSDLRGSLQGNDKLEELLLEAVGNTEKLDKLKGEIGEGGSNA
ncbi:MAG TPA: type VI secretion system contractile sheath small subunit [Terracidiphilus sp.]|nr:type VI secretion system contractile sheath small subunit [Terracidiphilus sp.]